MVAGLHGAGYGRAGRGDRPATLLRPSVPPSESTDHVLAVSSEHSRRFIAEKDSRDDDAGDARSSRAFTSARASSPAVRMPCMVISTDAGSRPACVALSRTVSTRGPAHRGSPPRGRNRRPCDRLGVPPPGCGRPHAPGSSRPGLRAEAAVGEAGGGAGKAGLLLRPQRPHGRDGLLGARPRPRNGIPRASNSSSSQPIPAPRIIRPPDR